MKKLNTGKFIEEYLDMSSFGSNLIIKDYANFPRWLPLPCHLDHGWAPFEKPLLSDLSVKKPVMLVSSRRIKSAWKKESQIPVEIMGSPFIHYRYMHHIKIKPNAKGTIVFPSHSTPVLKSNFDIVRYCAQLQKLPKAFRPIKICLLWRDYIDKNSSAYKRAGFSVVTAGPNTSNSLEFVKNYYEILSSHKYSSSNDVGSYTFYAIEMGIPFFLLGDIPTMASRKGKRDFNVPKTYKMTDFNLGRHITNLFSTGPVSKISEEQRLYVMEEIGMNNSLSSEQLNKLLWKYFWKGHYYLRVPLYWLLNLARLIRDSIKKK